MERHKEPAARTATSYNRRFFDELLPRWRARSAGLKVASPS
jgi:hypothetical protein